MTKFYFIFFTCFCMQFNLLSIICSCSDRIRYTCQIFKLDLLTNEASYEKNLIPSFRLLFAFEIISQLIVHPQAAGQCIMFSNSLITFFSNCIHVRNFDVISKSHRSLMLPNSFIVFYLPNILSIIISSSIPKNLPYTVSRSNLINF